VVDWVLALTVTAISVAERRMILARLFKAGEGALFVPFVA
jgi:hypothetical protein